MYKIKYVPLDFVELDAKLKLFFPVRGKRQLL
jgi:hypothetical protein